MTPNLSQYGVVPVIAVNSSDDGLWLCEALMRGGLPVAEITFRTAAAAETIRAATKRFPELILGAGTVLTPEQMQQAADAGASFAVAPGCNTRVINAALKAGILFAPGVCTPSDVERAVEAGCSLLKFFPAEASGGIKMLKALIGPYGHLGITFCPTGGIKPENLPDYLAIPQVAFAGGTWLAPKDAVKARDWKRITTLAREAVAIVKAARP